MSNHTSLVPIVSVPPPPTYTMRQFAPLGGLADLVEGANGTIAIRRNLWRDGHATPLPTTRLLLRAREWTNPDEAAFVLDPLTSEAEWHDGGSLSFVETLIFGEEGTQFRTMYAPGFYTIFDSPQYKTFYSDNALKYANYVVITQIKAFGNWVEGYPACTVDPARDIDMSVVLINPHNRPAVLTIEFAGVSRPLRLRVDAHAARRVGFAAALGSEHLPWSGQVFVSGSNRVNMFFVSHDGGDPASVTAVEHSEVFRGDQVYESILAAPVQQLYRWKKRVFDGIRR